MKKVKKGTKCPTDGYLLTKEEYKETIRNKRTIEELEEMFHI